MANLSLYSKKSYIDLGDQFFKKDKEITIMLWFNIIDGKEEQTLISQNYDCYGTYRLEFGVCKNKTFYFSGECGDNYGSNIENDKWNHISYVYKDNKMISYLNGKKDIELTMTDFQDINTCLLTYARGGFYFFNGYIDEVKVYNYALSEKEINNKMCKIEGKNKNLLRYYNFDKVEDGNKIKDLISRQYSVINNFDSLSKNHAPVTSNINFIIKQANDYYNSNSNLYKVSKNNLNLEEIYNLCKNYGSDNNIENLYNTLYLKKTFLFKNKIYKSDNSIQFNYIKNIYYENNQIFYKCNPYRILDLLMNDFELVLFKKN